MWKPRASWEVPQSDVGRWVSVCVCVWMIWGYWGDNRGFRGLVDPEGVRSRSVWVRLLKAFLTCTHTHTCRHTHAHTGHCSYSLWTSSCILDSALCVNVCPSMCVMSERAQYIRSPGRCSNQPQSQYGWHTAPAHRQEPISTKPGHIIALAANSDQCKNLSLCAFAWMCDYFMSMWVCMNTLHFLSIASLFMDFSFPCLERWRGCKGN